MGSADATSAVSRHRCRPRRVVYTPPTELNVRGIGSQGLLRKRPTELVLSAPDWELHATEVSMLLRHSGSYKAGEEGSLLAALGGASA